MATEVEYHCPQCGCNFVVYHHDEDRNTHCHWCEGAVILTGRIRTILDGEIVTFQDGVEVFREPSKERPRKDTRVENNPSTPG